VLAAILWAQGSAAADLVLFSPEPVDEQDVDLTLPAVSGINGKLEFDLGAFSLPASALFRAAGSLSLPVGDVFGLQFDVAAQNSGAGLLYGGAIHAFTRDPMNYLIGVTGGVVRSSGATLAVIGPEAELYLDRFSLEAWAGVGNLNYDDPLLADLNGVVLLADAAYYITDDWRVSAGGSHLLGYNALHLATEYQFREMSWPFSITGDLRYGQDGAYTITAGLKGYFGGGDKSLIDRHRQDDPPNRALNLFGAVGTLLFATAPPVVEEVVDPEQACLDAGGDWIFDFDPDVETFVCSFPD
jgi:hypothetical protein